MCRKFLIKDILAMVEKSYLFKVETNLGSSTMYEKSYRVKRVTADPVLVEKFQTKYKDLMKNVHEEDVSLVDGVVDGGALNSSDTIVQIEGVNCIECCIQRYSGSSITRWKNRALGADSTY